MIYQLQTTDSLSGLASPKLSEGKRAGLQPNNKFLPTRGLTTWTPGYASAKSCGTNKVLALQK